jgi:hypothetical protein
LGTIFKNFTCSGTVLGTHVLTAWKFICRAAYAV